MSAFVIDKVRGGAVESCHRVSLAVSDAAGRLVARAGDPALITFMRSAAKPFQALPLVQDGAVERFAITSRELALACASHNSERYQVEIVRAWLERIGCTEDDLACGPHPSLGRDYAVIDGNGRAGDVVAPSPLASNCSGKHAGMLTLAKHEGWESAGYYRVDHPVQRRVKRELARWCCVEASSIAEGTDGCGVVTYALPVTAMARGIAALVTSGEHAAQAIVGAMSAHPDLVAGTGRLCTALMEAYRHRVVAKVGAEGVYVVGLPDRGLGVALKVEDGDGKAAIVAVVAVLDQLGVDPSPGARFPLAAELSIRNTREEIVGQLRARGELTFV